MLDAFQKFTEDAKRKATQAYGALDKNAFVGYLPGGASREAGAATDQIPVSVGNIIQKGAIPVVPLHTSMEGPAKFLKSMAGPLGMPFNIQPALTGRKEKFQDEISRATRVGDTLSYGTNDAGYKAPQGLKEELERGIYGQWTAQIKDNGDVVLREGIGPGQQPYDTNRDADWHNKKAAEAKEKGDWANYIGSKIFATYDNLNKAGWTNNAPSGTQEQIIGNIDIVGTPGASSNELSISVPETIAIDPVNEPATAYAIQAGDTLSSIARANNMSVEELARKNQIANPDLISIGQTLNF